MPDGFEGRGAVDGMPCFASEDDAAADIAAFLSCKLEILLGLVMSLILAQDLSSTENRITYCT